MSIKIKCDLCKKNVDGILPENYFHLIPVGRYKVSHIARHFCEKCYWKIIKFIIGKK